MMTGSIFPGYKEETFREILLDVKENHRKNGYFGSLFLIFIRIVIRVFQKR